MALTQKAQLDKTTLLHCYQEYMNFSVKNPPSRKQFILNLESTLKDSDFIGDTKALLRSGIHYDQEQAYDLVRSELLEKL